MAAAPARLTLTALPNPPPGPPSGASLTPTTSHSHSTHAVDSLFGSVPPSQLPHEARLLLESCPAGLGPSEREGVRRRRCAAEAPSIAFRLLLTSRRSPSLCRGSWRWSIGRRGRCHWGRAYTPPSPLYSRTCRSWGNRQEGGGQRGYEGGGGGGFRAETPAQRPSACPPPPPLFSLVPAPPCSLPTPSWCPAPLLAPHPLVPPCSSCAFAPAVRPPRLTANHVQFSSISPRTCKFRTPLLLHSWRKCLERTPRTPWSDDQRMTHCGPASRPGRCSH